MTSFIRKAAPVLAGASLLMLAATQGAQAQCNTITSKGTAGSVDSAKFQAYEAILQGTSWGMWSVWMGSGAKVGEAPGYTVKGLVFRCKPGGWGQECRARATLCKKG